MVELGTYNLSNVSTSTPSSDDFLFWASDAGGIGAISVTSNSAATALHLDHLQYDTLNTIAAVPEPSTMVVASAGFVGIGLLFAARRRAPPVTQACFLTHR